MEKSNSKEFKDPTLRDFFVTKDELIFSVPDYFHPAKGIRSVLRYIPDVSGPRVRRNTGKRYRKAEFKESFDYLKTHHPDWVFDVAVVPRTEIAEILKPNDVVIEILEGKRNLPAAAELIHRFKDDGGRMPVGTGIPAESMGITGSILAGLESDESDIDFVVYGDDWKTAKEKLKKMKDDDRKEKRSFKIAELDDAMLQKVYKKRKSPLSFNDFFDHEMRKGNRGMFTGIGNDREPDGTDGKSDSTGVKNDRKNVYFDLLFARSENQLKTPIQRGKDIEKIEIEAIVTNDDFAFDSPAIYLIDHDEIDEIYSYTHTYAGQALKGEKIRARGMLEIIEEENGKNKKRLVIGTTREAEDEWMISLSLLKVSENNNNNNKI